MQTQDLCPSPLSIQPLPWKYCIITNTDKKQLKNRYLSSVFGIYIGVGNSSRIFPLIKFNIFETQIEGYRRNQGREGSGDGEEWWIEKLFRAENRQGMEECLAQDREVLRRNSGLLADAC